MLPFSEACERNKGPILEILSRVLAEPARVVEIGAGTGQHSVHFARHLPHLDWQPTERAENLPSLAVRIAVEGTPNLRDPIELDAAWPEWPCGECDALYTANTLHIMGWPEVEALFQGVGRVLVRGGTLIIYGPFRYAGEFTTPSNATFDRSLRRRDPSSAIRDFEAVDALAQREGLGLVADHAMPANNQLLIWRRAAVTDADAAMG